MTRDEIEAEIRQKNPTTRLRGSAEYVGPGDPAYEAQIARWVADAVAAQPSNRSANRATLRAQWDALPPWIRGPFRAAFEAANRLLDEGDDDAAADLIRYQSPPTGYTEEQRGVFAQVQAGFAAGIENLNS